MTTYIRCGQLWQMAIAIAATSSVIFSWNSAVAQVVEDSTLGTKVTPNVDIKGLPSDRIDGGTTRGANLFHSFQEFSVREGRGAYFSNPAGIENIFSRVTGNNASNISGTLGVLGNANLFLLNPNGIIFGPNAKLDVGGSFFASTANSLNFGDGQQFSAKNPADAPLLTVKVPLGVQFNQEQPKAIVNSGNLSVGTGQNLTLAGGTVASTGQLSAPGGQVAVAAVPGGSVLNLSSSGQLLNIDSSSSVVSVSSSPLTELLRSVDEKVRPGLTVHSNGQVELTGSGLSVVDGDVVARNVTAETATLTANHNLTLAESQIGTTGDLNLLAGDTVRVRDSVANAFVAKAGGNLTIRGNKGIDILALNHSQTPFVSGGTLSLISDGNISGDAHFSSGGNFSILNLSGGGGNFVSLYDPIIRSNGDVEIGDYTGASLKIESAGNITTGAITINSPDTSAAIDVNDPDYQTLTNGKALILRAGNDTLSGSVQEPNPLNGASSVNYSSSRSSAGNLTINGNIKSDNFQVPLTVILEANGSIGSISTRDINSTAFSGNGGNISITANGDITTSSLTSFIDRNGQGNAGDIQVTSNTGNITIGGSINSQSSNGVAGNVTLTAARDIRTRNIIASSKSNENFSTITLKSSQGSVILDRVKLSTTNTGTDYAGDIRINGKDIQITNNSEIESKGRVGTVSIGTVDTNTVTINNSRLNTTNSSTPTTNEDTNSAGDIEINGNNIEITNNSEINSQGEVGTISIGTGDTNTVTINNSLLSTDNNENEISGDIKINGRNIEITNSSQINSRGVLGRIFIGRIIDIDNNENQQYTVTADNVTIRKSQVNATRDRDASSVSSPDNELDNEINNAIQIFSNGRIQIEESTVTASTIVSTAPSGNILVRATDSVLLSGSGFTDFRDPDFTKSTNTSRKGLFAEATQNGINAGGIDIRTDLLIIENGAAVSVSSPQGRAGNVVILADKIRLNNGAIFASTGQTIGNRNEGANIILLGEQTTQSDVEKLDSLIFEDKLRGENLPGSPLDFLILGNESLIETNAKNSANGGNIAIKTRLLLALPPGKNGNDISANAEKTGRGGVVAIDPRPFGIYGTEFRPKTQNTPLNDITASSEQGPQGTVAIVPLDVDPKRGFLQLPEDLGDSSKLITQSCPVGVSRAASRFVITGRGGLPPKPSSPLSSDAFVGNASSLPNNRPEQTSSTSSTPVEAQGVVIGSKGEIILTANPSKLTSYRSWQRFTGCNE
ncbi:filamentous hemagglutinin N-terminal domain-containing protein [Brasilonema sp. UFV-L1]|uniref:two-partner secretion domain-containing protein n=1 Tax=Brasilonema sp. UFV-L1 TaxID=2234130 RepID=UPI00145F56F8|nr:filamentous hemagglutinin N-terminal domain-containing protein [Brasilonema sp. UFV-L1]NMG10210.1 hypothetical protein [Brasilonema sp. UFV-L1]